MALAHHERLWCSSSVAAITAPPTTSLWPLRYLVVECITKSAPRDKGCRQPPGPVGRVAGPSNIDHPQQGIAGGLDPHQFRLQRKRRAQLIGVALIDEINHEISLGVQRIEQPISAAVAVVRGDHA